MEDHAAEMSEPCTNLPDSVTAHNSSVEAGIPGSNLRNEDELLIDHREGFAADASPTEADSLSSRTHDDHGLSKDHCDAFAAHSEPTEGDNLSSRIRDEYELSKVIWTQYHQERRPIALEEASQQSRHMSDRIFEYWHTLHALLDKYEATIRKRWTKKTKSQRVQILLNTWPGMAAMHRPDFAALRRETAEEREAGSRFRSAYLWPHINLEDLSKPKALLLLINARGRNPPGAFAMADWNMAVLGHSTQAIGTRFLDKYTMMLTNRKASQSYGELVAWADNEDAYEWVLSGTGMQPGEGLIVLEMQQQVMRFLVECCMRIMHDIPQDRLTSDEFLSTAQTEPPNETVNNFASLAVVAAEAPYRLPGHLDLDRLESLFAAQVSASEDHVWALREDPAYFADTMMEYKEHRLEQVKDVNGKAHPLTRLSQHDNLWRRIIGAGTQRAYMSLETATKLHQQTIRLRELQRQYADDIAVDKDLPEEYLDALLKFHFYLKQASQGPVGQLEYGALCSPPLRSYFAWRPARDAPSSMVEVVSKPGTKLGKLETELAWRLRMLWQERTDTYYLCLPDMVDELERFIQSEPGAKECVTTYIAKVIGHLAMFSEALRHLRMYQPWAHKFEDQFLDRQDVIRQDYLQDTDLCADIASIVDAASQTNIATLGSPASRRFYYPIDKCPTKENIEAIRRAESKLDEFWSSLDQIVRSAPNGNKFGDTAIYPFTESRNLRRTPEWVEPVKEQTISNQRDRSIEGALPLSEGYFDLQHRTERTLQQHDGIRRETRSKPKIKTRSKQAQPWPTDISADLCDAPSAHTLHDGTLRVDMRACSVFRTLFCTPTPNATPGEIAWQDFLHAMVSVGFAPEKLYGSVWQFQPNRLDVGRSIQFHEPHPSGKIPYVRARRFGRRLERAYGWRGETFVLKEKDGKS